MALQTGQLSQRRAIRGQTIRNDFIRNIALAFQQFPEQFQRGGLVPPLLDEDIKDFSLHVDGTPQEHPHTFDARDHFIEMPDAVGTPALSANVGGDCGTELVGPAANGLVTDVDPAFG